MNAIHSELQQHTHAGTLTQIGRRNVVWGWATIGLGALSGLVIGMWSFSGPFPTPSGFHDYADLPRRLIRLAHICLFMLPLINIMIGKDLDRAQLSLRWKQICSIAALFAMIGIPVALLLAVTIDLRLKYLALPPAHALLLSLTLMGLGVVRRRSP